MAEEQTEYLDPDLVKQERKVMVEQHKLELMRIDKVLEQLK